LNQKTIRLVPRGTFAAIAALGLAWCVTPGWAAAPPATAPAPAGSIKQNLESRYPGVHVLDVKPSAMPNVYEVYLGSELLYTDANADYLLGGPLVDTQTHQNLTEARLNDYGKVDFRTLPLDRAIKVVKGNGSRRLVVFSDPDCPFCQQLEKSLLPINNVTMYVLLYPIASLHPQAPAKAHAIWCAKDRAQAWSQWMQEKKLPPDTACSGVPIDELQQLGERLHINSTPTMFLADGRRISGAISTEELERALSSSGGGSVASAASPK
jgi:thiol:disulfide interchange protein DsbC